MRIEVVLINVINIYNECKDFVYKKYQLINKYSA